MLWMEYYISLNHGRFIRFAVFWYAYPGFFLWNLLTTWWIYHSTAAGAIMAVVLNALFMTTVFSIFSWTKRKLKSPGGAWLSLVFFWMSFEYLHLNWILTWPWLNIGNGFASCYKWVQWYEYTGTMGGTLWVLTANILAFESGRKITITKTGGALHALRSILTLRLLLLVLWIGVPIAGSFLIYHHYMERKNPVSFIVVQPNLDPYSEQYNMPPVEVIGQIMQLSASSVDSSTNFLVAPESAIQESMWENDLRTFQSISLLKEVINHYPNLNIIIGGSTFRMFNPGEPLSRTARKFKDADKYYDAFNTAILINRMDSLQLYHKSKLTPGVEALPSFRGFRWLENLALDLGGTVGSLGTDRHRKVFHTEGNIPVSSAICYESAFGEFFSRFVRNGATVMIIITNDGWWGDTPGHRQHYAFSHLRAIETRRSIARSANTGISAFIDQRGDAHLPTAYWEPAVISGTLHANDSITLYTRHGDYLARIAVFATFIILAWCLVLTIRKK